ncbi:N-acetylmuramoyl-L-alanine amidase [Methylomicrobium sp. Wu6]|uniref:N-acetylmuramoyl-L-alanine amidase family protein n=1 Tax=Methylomicrobium sp. Wu6 TaxID=3107928 RepID=UPI002DD62D85|nr:N-acetylmuramoyl-L-alanine amidase [Methylomicrobium sp. Wu6]MEC4749038.1 N-acetylmuramoyl-L-alanine amidase [Methylomicrobium sp. Wu6]
MPINHLILLLYLLTFPATAAEVALDIGHSRNNPGVVSAGGIPEWELNRQLALAVAARLQRIGISYRLIGADGDMEVLTDRTALAKKDTLFISLHHDSVQPEWLAHVDRYSGYSLFVSRQNRKLHGSLACAKQIGDRLLATSFHPSRYHATAVKGENRPFADQSRGIHYYDGLAVLRTAHQPAVLIEAGVAVNPQDEISVTGTEGRGRVSEAIAQAIAGCLKTLRK